MEIEYQNNEDNRPNLTHRCHNLTFNPHNIATRTYIFHKSIKLDIYGVKKQNKTKL